MTTKEQAKRYKDIVYLGFFVMSSGHKSKLYYNSPRCAIFYSSNGKLKLFESHIRSVDRAIDRLIETGKKTKHSFAISDTLDADLINFIDYYKHTPSNELFVKGPVKLSELFDD